MLARSISAPAVRGLGNPRIATALIATTYFVLAPPQIINFGKMLPFVIPLFLVALHLAYAARPVRGYTLLPLPIILFVGWFTMTTLWSSRPSDSVVQSALLVGVVAIALVVGSRITLREVVGGVLVGGLALLAVSVVVAVIIPGYGLMGGSYQSGALRGIVIHRNVMSAILVPPVIAAMAFDFRGHRPRLTRFLTVLVLLGGILATRSSTGLVTALVAVALGLLILALRRVKQRYRILPALGSVILVGGVATFLVTNSETALSILGRDATFTGRTDIWNSANALIAQQPFIGYGWGGVWGATSPILRMITADIGYEVPEAHSGYLDTWLQVGLIGLLVFYVVMATVFLRGLRLLFRVDTTLIGWAPTLVVATLLSDITETISIQPYTLFALCLTLVVLGRDGRRSGSTLSADEFSGALGMDDRSSVRTPGGIRG